MYDRWLHAKNVETGVDGLSGYRCSLRDSSNVRKDGKPTFPQPRGCVSTLPLGPVIKTETSQHSTMNAPYLPARPSVRLKGPVGRWGGEGGSRRQLVNSRRLSSIRETRDRREGGGGRGKWQNRKLGPRRFARDRRCSEKGGTHKASEWGGGGGREGNSCRIPAVHPFIHPTRLLPKDFSPQKIPFSHSNVTKDDSRPSSLPPLRC